MNSTTLTPVIERLERITAELHAWSTHVDGAKMEQLKDEIRGANRIFVAGAGKSGIAVKALANRLMHLGFTVYVAGDITTPSIREGDLLIINSARGETASLVAMVKTAVDVHARIATLTMTPDATIGRAANVAVLIPGQGGTDHNGHEIFSEQPPGSLFEDLCLLSYGAIVAELKDELEQTVEQMRYRHANLE